MNPSRRRALRALEKHIELERMIGCNQLPMTRPTDRTASSPDGLAALCSQVHACTRCEIAGSRNKAVFGEGSPRARLMFIGEAPGADEDRSGRPFVGKAGQLLTRIIQSIGLERSEVYIANLLKCRPPGNRTPRPDEVENCLAYLRQQILAIRPDVICTLGAPAARALFGFTEGITAFRGRVVAYEGITALPTFHPAYLLRNPSEKIKVWRDIQLVAKLLEKRRA